MTPESRVGAAEPGLPRPTLSGMTSFLVLLGLFLAILLAGMDALVVNTALPKISASLHQTAGVTFVVAAYLITSTVSIPIFSKLSDRFSRRNVFLAGLVIFIGGSALAGLSQNLGELIAFRGVQGFGSGGFIPVGIAMVAVLYPPEMRARLTGILSGAGGISIVAGPILGSYIVDVTTWRWVFYVNLPIGIVAMAVLWLILGPLRPEVRGHVDYVGAALLSGWVGALMLPLVEVTEDGWTWTAYPTLALLAGAVALVGAFLWWELREADPLVPLRLLGRRTLAACGGISLFNGIVLTSALTFLSVYVGVIQHPGPNSANDVRDLTYFFAIPMILGAALGGQFLSRFAYRAVLVPGLALATIASLPLTQITATTPLWIFQYGVLPVGGFTLPLIPMGFGLGSGLAGVLIIAQNEVTKDEVGATIGLTRFLQSLGGAVGLSLLTAFQEWRLQVGLASATTAEGATQAVVSSYAEVFAIMTVLILIAFAFALFLRGRVTPGSGAHEPAADTSASPPVPE